MGLLFFDTGDLPPPNIFTIIANTLFRSTSMHCQHSSCGSALCPLPLLLLKHRTPPLPAPATPAPQASSSTV